LVTALADLAPVVVEMQHIEGTWAEYQSDLFGKRVLDGRIPSTSSPRVNGGLKSAGHESGASVGQFLEGPMNYHEFNDDALLMMHYSTRGALAVDDELMKLGAEPRFRVRETSDWRRHAGDLEAEMTGRGMIFDVIDWSEIQKVDCDTDSAALQPETSQPDFASAPSNLVSLASEADDNNSRLKRRIAAFIKMR
jgi:hypothetical protein